MTNKEQFDNDVKYNSKHIIFTMDDDDYLGCRDKGVYINEIMDGGHQCRSYVFDNGHHYLFDINDNTLYICDKFPKDFFIHKYIQKILHDFANMWLQKSLEENVEICCSQEEIEIKSVIRLLPYRDDKIVYISNIIIPKEIEHKGLGKRLIKDIYIICKELGYRLILLNVVDSFANSLKKRNAKFLDFDKIEITNDTILE